MKEQKKQPELRFKGFTDDWEQVKLKDVAIYIRGSFPQPYTNPDFYDELNGKPFVQVTDIGFNLKLNPDTRAHISKLAENKSRFVEAGKVVVALQGSIEKSIGRTAITQYDAFFDRTILIFQSYKIPMNDRYFAQVIERLFEYEKEKAWGATISTITKEKLNDFIIGVTDLREQIEIGEFFQKLDQAITLQQRKLELLKKIKQGYLQQLFPSKGQSIPNIRFLEFKENWIQKKLGNYLSIPEKKQVDNLKDLKLMTLKLNLGGINLSANRETLELGATKYFVRKSGQLIYGKQNFFHGSIAIIPDNADGYATSGDVPALDIEGIQPKFLLDYISRPSYYLEKEARAIGTGSKRIHEKDLFSFEISSPSQIEQIKITNIVDNMDKILILQKSKIQKLKQLKQAYLQKLFP
ncbi:restriction endonuclease subunit S [Latilactobacillus curvatus]|uniref:restriction endonuclease subunit S n=1 Tax=Latilactobacillus curvatus TaxID=28038 RepID=UPI0021A37810|nr:restriction endonuclease subunit S [Latilactobacillus curvatus]MCT3529760.1 restriction endonuclease subunit S [Latilactobacillus curvatus]